MKLKRLALTALTGGLFITAAALNTGAVILTLGGVGALIATLAIGHAERSAQSPRTAVRPPITLVRIEPDEPRDAVPPGYPGYRGSVQYVPHPGRAQTEGD